MQINIAEQLAVNGAAVKLDFDFNFTVALPKDILSFEAVKIKGSLTNESGTYIFNADCSSSMKACCARCLKETNTPLMFKISEKYKMLKNLSIENSDDDLIYFEGGFIDLTDAINENILLNLPFKVLCNPNCKGLCEVCGADLNETECDCKNHIDNVFSRFSKFLITD